MDREAALIRSEVSQTRAEIDRKLQLLGARAHDLSPRRLTERFLPDYLLDRTIGAGLTLIGMKMAWKHWRNGHNRRARVRAALESYGRGV
jgi:hypothetical protein